MDDSYNGYDNRETLTVCTWLKQDDTLSKQTQGLSVEELKFYVETLRDISHEGNRFLQSMMDDVGSLWRVNWNQVHTSCQVGKGDV